MEEIEDQVLNLVVQGNEVACRKVVAKYQQFVYNLALRITKNPEDAEEVAQDSFLNAFRHLNSFNRKAKFSTWLYRITFNNAITKVRKKQLPKTTINPETEYLLPIDTAESSLEKMQVEERKKILALAIEQLNTLDQTLITLYYLHEHSMEEISEITGINANNVKIKIHRARKKLYQLLSDLLRSEKKDFL